MKNNLEETPLRIVLADDDEDDRLFFKDAITSVKVRHDFAMFEDGMKLMEHLADGASQSPHLVFLDLNMPRKSGIECLREIRADEKLKDIIVVIYSTSSADIDIEATFLAGANIYITKPNSIDKLKALIADVIAVNWQYHTSNLNRENFVMVR
jgi:CheY-like chemotaxis protein